MIAAATRPRSDWSVSRASFDSASSSDNCCPIEGDAQIGEELVEESPPRPDPRDALLGRDLLLRLGQLVRPVPAFGAEDRGVALERGVGQQVLGDLVVELAPLEVEEQDVGLDLRIPLAHLLEERSARLVRAVGRLAQAGVDLDPRRAGLEPLELRDRLVQLRRESSASFPR